MPSRKHTRPPASDAAGKATCTHALAYLTLIVPIVDVTIPLRPCSLAAQYPQHILTAQLTATTETAVSLCPFVIAGCS